MARTLEIMVLAAVVGISAPNAAGAQVRQNEGLRAEIGVGPAISGTPGWADRASNATGVGALVRLTLPVAWLRVGAEVTSWLGRGRESYASGFPLPSDPPPTTRSRPTTLQRTAISVITLLDISRVTIKGGLGTASVDAIERLDCEDCNIVAKTNRSGSVVSLGIAGGGVSRGPLDIAPAVDAVVRYGRNATSALHVSMIMRWHATPRP